MKKIYIYGFRDSSQTYSDIGFFENDDDALNSAINWAIQVHFDANEITPENLSKLSYDDLMLLVNYIRKYQKLCAKEIPETVEKLVALDMINPKTIPYFYKALETFTEE